LNSLILPGRILVLVWSVFTLTVLAFYLSNLRSDLMSENYEAPVDTSADVVARDQVVYMHSISHNNLFR
jgi:hypothetical protein